jgi:Zn-finger nucleic acid-binding protein
MNPNPHQIEIDERRPGTLPCPVCGVPMDVERKENVEIDVCAEHGIWLDQGRIEAITKAVELRSRVFERSNARVAVQNERDKAMLYGSAFGWWSFLFR